MESNNQTSVVRGGARLGAGRKRRDLDVWLTARGITPATASELLNNANERKLWHRLFNSDDDRIVLQALMFLTTMRDGKPAQSINVTSTNFNLNARDIETARAIVAEIRGDANPRLGPHVGSPLQVDANLDSNQLDNGQPDDNEGLSEGNDVDNIGLVTDSMLSENEGGISDGVGNG